jgi:hypothetical protein
MHSGDESGASFSFEHDDPQYWPFLLGDARATAERALDPRLVTDADADGLEHMSQAKTNWYKNMTISAAECGIDVTPGIVTYALIGCLLKWDGNGETLMFLWDYLPEIKLEPREAAVLVGAHRLLHSLALADNVPQSRAAIATAATDLAIAFQQSSRYEDAIAAALLAANIAQDANGRLAASELLKESAVAAGKQDVLGLALAFRARALVELASGDGTLRHAAFDAVFDALRYAPSGDAEAPAGSELWRALQVSDDLTPFRPLFKLAFVEPPTDDPGKAVSFERAARLLRPAWDFDATQLSSLASDINTLYVDVENKRGQIEPPGQEEVVEAKWATWSFDNPAYRRAIPHGTSIKREKHLDQILLVISHELAHIFSMNSGIGVAVIALRAAAFGREEVLWTFLTSEEYATAPVVGVAPLIEGDLLALAEAEQALEISRKLQILQGVWNPWFEGVAAFNELAADPTAEGTGSSIGDVLANIVDQSLPQNDPDLERTVLGRRTELELRYADAQRGEGHDRLRAYLDEFHAKYLPGYLAVRMVVAAWRSQLEKPLSGSEAARILLHLIRFGSLDAVPPLNMPSSEFAAAARRQMVDWVAQTAAISAEDLLTCLARSTDPFVWDHGRLVTLSVSMEESSTRMHERYQQFVLEATASLVGANAAVDRVANANESCREMMASAAAALTSSKPNLGLADDLFYELQDFLGLLPLGQVSAPFWLNRPTRCSSASSEQQSTTRPMTVRAMTFW